VHWVAVVHNPDPCAVRASWRAELQVRERGAGRWRAVRIQFATMNFYPNDTILDGVFCYRFSSNTRDVRVEYLFEDQATRGSNGKVQERAADPNSYSDTPDSGIPTSKTRSDNPT